MLNYTIINPTSIGGYRITLRVQIQINLQCLRAARRRAPTLNSSELSFLLPKFTI